MNNKTLLVDDETISLETYRRALRDTASCEIAASAEEGIRIIKERGPFAVVVADYRMPNTDGIQFLREVEKISPQTVRLMLTGQADLETIISAVNEGHVFRFLTKPCPREDLIRTIGIAIKQHQLITAERELMEKTLNGSMAVLIDVLSLVNPTAFGHASRVKRMVSGVTESLGLSQPWLIQLAAMMSQIGYVILPPSLTAKAWAGKPLSKEESSLLDSAPSVARRLLGHIPRLETVIEMMDRSGRRFSELKPGTADLKTSGTTVAGGFILKAVLDFDRLLSQGLDMDMALGHMQEDEGAYHPALFPILKSLPNEFERLKKRFVTVEELRPGMIFGEDVTGGEKAVLVTKGQEVTDAVKEQLLIYKMRREILEPILVLVPVGE